MKAIEIGFAPRTVNLNDGTYLHFWYANNAGRGGNNCTIIRSTDPRAALSAKQTGILATELTSAWRGKVNFSETIRFNLGVAFRYQAIEDNGGGLHLAVLDAAGTCFYMASNFEFSRGDLTACIDALKLGENPIEAGWGGGLEDPNAAYERMISYEYGYEIVADNRGIYPEKMGFAARKEFGIDPAQ